MSVNARRIILGFCLVWATALIAVGLWYLTALSTQSVAFLTGVLGLVQIPIFFYFRQR